MVSILSHSRFMDYNDNFVIIRKSSDTINMLLHIRKHLKRILLSGTSIIMKDSYTAVKFLCNGLQAL
jgi:hypothetical protein